MSLVLDCSVTLAWHFDDESTPAADGVLDRVAAAGAVVPALWHLEVASALRAAARRGRITLDYRDFVLAGLRRLAIAVDEETSAKAWTATLAFSDRFGLTPYDAAYVELAQRRRLPLASLDRAMRDAGARLGLELLGVAA
jgi:predicted nucleic acid-binding protein